MSSSDSSRPSRIPWTRRYAALLLLSDLAVIAAVLVVYDVLWAPGDGRLIEWPTGPEIPYWAGLIVIGAVWWLCLEIFDSRDERVVGHGVAEYQRVARASGTLFATIIAIAFFLRIDLARSILIVAIPVGAVLLMFSRWVWRRWLRRQQAQGDFVHRVVVVGEQRKAEHIVRTVHGTEGTGLLIKGIVTERGDDIDPDDDIEVLGSYDELGKIIDAERIDSVIFASADDLPPAEMRRLGWAMADRDVDVIVAPAMTEIAGPRIHSRPVAGLPLVQISYPRLDGGRRVAKRTFDIIGSGLLLILLSPVFLGVMIAIRSEGRGPFFYKQERVGRRGRLFGMIKFRSMIVNADDQLASLLDAQGTSDKPLHKVTDDPRITKVGRILRRYSLDELPQLVNVFKGDMSLVGPRPQRPAEVALYDDDAKRRLLVKPGMSGLWQVSGRSSLDWEDALRLDLYYVENWSFTQDIVILFRTVRAVVDPGDTAH